VRGDLCPYDHGVDPVVVDNVGLHASVLAFPGPSLLVFITILSRAGFSFFLVNKSPVHIHSASSNNSCRY